MKQEEGDGSKKTKMIARSSLQDILNIQASNIEEQMLWGIVIIVTTFREKKNFFDSTRKRQYQHCQI